MFKFITKNGQGNSNDFSRVRVFRRNEDPIFEPLVGRKGLCEGPQKNPSQGNTSEYLVNEAGDDEKASPMGPREVTREMKKPRVFKKNYKKIKFFSLL